MYPPQLFLPCILVSWIHLVNLTTLQRGEINHCVFCLDFPPFHPSLLGGRCYILWDLLTQWREVSCLSVLQVSFSHCPSLGGVESSMVMGRYNELQDTVAGSCWLQGVGDSFKPKSFLEGWVRKLPSIISHRSLRVSLGYLPSWVTLLSDCAHFLAWLGLKCLQGFCTGRHPVFIGV